jgi:hypothetical protein
MALERLQARAPIIAYTWYNSNIPDLFMLKKTSNEAVF